LVDELYICLRLLRRHKRIEQLSYAVKLCQRITAIGYNPVVLSKGRVTGAQVINAGALTVPQGTKTKPNTMDTYQLCPLCKEKRTSGTVSYKRWQQSSALKAAVPTLTWQAREYLIKFTCKQCWNDLFSTGEQP
jgi:hypothetical protein